MSPLKTTAAIFIPCIVEQFYPEIGESVVQIMETLGEDFGYPEAQTCCGLPSYNMGHWDSAIRPVRPAFIFDRAVERG